MWRRGWSWNLHGNQEKIFVRQWHYLFHALCFYLLYFWAHLLGLSFPVCALLNYKREGTQWYKVHTPSETLGHIDSRSSSNTTKSEGRVLCFGRLNHSKPRVLEFVPLIRQTLGPLVHRIRRVFFVTRLEFSLLQNGTDLLWIFERETMHR